MARHRERHASSCAVATHNFRPPRPDGVTSTHKLALRVRVHCHNIASKETSIAPHHRSSRPTHQMTNPNEGTLDEFTRNTHPSNPDHAHVGPSSPSSSQRRPAQRSATTPRVHAQQPNARPLRVKRATSEMNSARKRSCRGLRTGTDRTAPSNSADVSMKFAFPKTIMNSNQDFRQSWLRLSCVCRFVT